MQARSHIVMFAVAALSFGIVCLAEDAVPAAAEQPAAAATQPAGLTGLWTWEVEGPGGAMTMELNLKQEGEALTGTISGFGGDVWDIEEGSVKDGVANFKVTREWGDQTMVTTYVAKLDGQTLKGESKTVLSREFEASRAKP